MKPDIWNRCDECGWFIPLSHFADGRATRRLVAPETPHCMETWETLCERHTDAIKHVAALRGEEEGKP